MAESKNYLVQKQEGGNILISEEVIASIAALAVRDVEGVYGLSVSQVLDFSNILRKKNLGKGIRVTFTEDSMDIACNLVVMMGSPVMAVARNVQEAIADAVTSMTGTAPLHVHVNVCGVAVPKETKPAVQ